MLQASLTRQLSVVSAVLLAIGACSAPGDAGRGEPTMQSAGDFVEGDPSPRPGGAGAPSSGGIIGDGEPSNSQEPGLGRILDGTACNAKNIEFESIVPTVTLLLDRSGSMFEAPYFNAPDRWTPLREAVLALEPFSKDVAFSLINYTNTHGPACPLLEHLDMVPAQNNFEAIKAALQPSELARPLDKAETPTAEAIDLAVEMLSQHPSEGPEYLLVITDGEPDTCLFPDPQCGQDRAIGAAQAAFQAGIQTIVVGISGDVGERFLNDLAHAGRGLEVLPPPDNQLFCVQKEPKPGTTGDAIYSMPDAWRVPAWGTYAALPGVYAEQLFFRPDSLESLTAQLAKLIQGVRTCSFEMNTAVKRELAGRGVVRLTNKDGTFHDLVYGSEWDLDAVQDHIVELKGTACDAVLDTATDAVSKIQIEFPCDVRVPRVK